MISPSLLTKVYGIKPSSATKWVKHIDAAVRFCDASEPKRLAAFLAQIGHESGCLRYTREIWGPTDQQRRYDPVTTLAGRLGNIYPGDGKTYMGRGLIQTTGRANYAMTTVMLRKLLGPTVPDFEADPLQLELPSWAALSAGLFWRVKGLNRFADTYDFLTLTRRINGGTNGLAHRQALYTQALGALT